MDIKLEINKITESFKGVECLPYTVLLDEFDKLDNNPSMTYTYENKQDYVIRINYKEIMGVLKVIQLPYNYKKNDYLNKVIMKDGKCLEYWSNDITDFEVITNEH